MPEEYSEIGPLGGGLPSGVVARLRERSQLDFDLEFYGRILDRSADYVDVLRCQGQILSRKGRYPEALEIDRKLIALRPNDAVAYYNLSCSLALMGYADEAVEALRNALERGYDDYSYLESDSDLDSLREDPAYRGLMRDYGIEN